MKAVLAGAWFIAAAVLLGVGWVLAPDAADSMEGAQRILFTAIPVRPFAWAMALVFSGLGVVTLRADGEDDPGDPPL